jgi:hypothetical protein
VSDNYADFLGRHASLLEQYFLPQITSDEVMRKKFFGIRGHWTWQQGHQNRTWETQPPSHSLHRSVLGLFEELNQKAVSGPDPRSDSSISAAV